MVRSRMVEYLLPGEPASHLYNLVADYPLRPSKMLRSALCLATCQALGSPAEVAIDCAVAIELLHSAFMVHDDIEDDSEVRRGRATLHVAHGLPLALNAGDALAFLALRPLVDGAQRRGLALSWTMLGEILDVVARTVEGQAVELGWIRDERFDLEDQDYLDMVIRKTCWYTAILPCRLGELAAAGNLAGDWHVPFGTYLGASFQIRDDVLNVTGSLDSYGKEIGGDIWEGKRTLLLVHLLRSCTPEQRQQVIAIYRLPRAERTAEQVSWIIDLMGDHGSIEYAVSACHGLAGAAHAELERALAPVSPSVHTRFLTALVGELITRQR